MTRVIATRRTPEGEIVPAYAMAAPRARQSAIDQAKRDQAASEFAEDRRTDWRAFAAVLAFMVLPVGLFMLCHGILK